MRRRNVIYALLALATLTGCSSVSLNHDWDRDADFSSYQSYDWLSDPTAAIGDARSAEERNTLLDKRIRNAVDAELQKNGFFLNKENPDILVVYHVGIADRVNVTDWGYRYGSHYWGYGGRDITVHNYQEGTLIIDLIDARKDQLVYRTSATKTLETNPSPERVEKTINDVVRKMFQSYPPKR